MTIQIEMRMVCSCGKSAFQTLEKSNDTFSISKTFGPYGAFHAKDQTTNEITLQCTTCGKTTKIAH